VRLASIRKALNRFTLRGRVGKDFESKRTPGCISLPKDEYENIGSLYLLNHSCGDRVGSAVASCAPAAAGRSVTSSVSFRNGERLARLEPGGQAASKAR